MDTLKLNRWPQPIVKRWVCECAKISASTYDYHQQIGDIPRPEKLLMEGTTDEMLYFDDHDIDKIFRFFNEREKHARKAKK